MNELLERYANTFDDIFPLFIYRGLPEERMKEMIINALKDGKPVQPDIDDDIIY